MDTHQGPVLHQSVLCSSALAPLANSHFVICALSFSGLTSFVWFYLHLFEPLFVREYFNTFFIHAKFFMNATWALTSDLVYCRKLDTWCGILRAFVSRMPGWLYNTVPPRSSHSLSISIYTHVPVAFIAQHTDQLIGQSRDSVHKACTQITSLRLCAYSHGRNCSRHQWRS